MVANNLAKDDFRFQHAFFLSTKLYIFFAALLIFQKEPITKYVITFRIHSDTLRNIIRYSHEKYKYIFKK